MRRLPRATALTALLAAMAAGATGCKEERKPAAKPAAPVAAQTPPPAARPAPTATMPTAPTEPIPRRPIKPVTPPPIPKDAGKRPAMVTDKHVEMAEKIVQAATHFATLMDAAKADCRKAIGVINKWGEEFKTEMAKVEVLKKELKGDQKAMAWFTKAYGPAMRKALATLGQAVGECRSFEEFDVAFRSLGIGGSSPAAGPHGAGGHGLGSGGVAPPPGRPAPAAGKPPAPAPGK